MDYEKAWNDLKDFLSGHMMSTSRLRADNYGDTSVDGLIMFFKTAFSDAIVQGVLDMMEGFENTGDEGVE